MSLPVFDFFARIIVSVDALGYVIRSRVPSGVIQKLRLERNTTKKSIALGGIIGETRQLGAIFQKD